MLKRLTQKLMLGAAILAADQARGDAMVLRGAGAAYADAKGDPLRNPEGVACTKEGRVVAADSGNGRLVLYQFKDGVLIPGAPIKFPELGYPTRVQIDSRGNLLSLDRQGRRIVRVNESGGFGAFVQPTGVPPQDGFFPVAFKLDAADRLVVLDLASARVVVLDAAGAFQSQIPWPPGARLTDLAVGVNGEILAADSAGAQIFGAAGGGFAPLGRNLRDAMSFPTYLTVTERGLIVVVDGHGNGLVLLGPDGSYLGRRLAIGWSEGFIYYPGQVCIDGQGDTFVADSGNNRVQVFTPVK